MAAGRAVYKDASVREAGGKLGRELGDRSIRPGCCDPSLGGRARDGVRGVGHDALEGPPWVRGGSVAELGRDLGALAADVVSARALEDAVAQGVGGRLAALTRGVEVLVPDVLEARACPYSAGEGLQRVESLERIPPGPRGPEQAGAESGLAATAAKSKKNTNMAPDF